MDKETRQAKSNDPVHGLCQLCHEIKSLCSSHIIPNLFFRRTKEPAQAIYFFTDGEGKIKKGQETWQEYLLCKKCEDQFGSYETYINQMLYYPDKVKVKITNSPHKQGFHGLNFRILKLFQLSILWRASISTQNEFARINLTYQQNEELRKILYHEKACQAGKYWCEMIVHENKNKYFPTRADVIIPPFVREDNGKLLFIFIFGGYAWIFHLQEKHFSPQKKKQLRRGSLFITKQDISEIPAIRSLIEKATRQGLFKENII